MAMKVCFDDGCLCIFISSFKYYQDQPHNYLLYIALNRNECSEVRHTECKRRDS